MFPDKITIVIFLFSSLLFDIHTRDIQTICPSKQPLQCYNTGECDVHLPYSKESTFWLNSALRFLLRKARAGSFPIIAACKTGRSTEGESHRQCDVFSVTTHNCISRFGASQWWAGWLSDTVFVKLVSDVQGWLMDIIFRLVYFSLPVTMTHSIFGKKRQLQYPPPPPFPSPEAKNKETI